MLPTKSLKLFSKQRISQRCSRRLLSVRGRTLFCQLLYCKLYIATFFSSSFFWWTFRVLNTGSMVVFPASTLALLATPQLLQTFACWLHGASLGERKSGFCICPQSSWCSLRSVCPFFSWIHDNQFSVLACGHAPMVFSSSADFLRAWVNCAPIVFSFSFSFSCTGFRLSSCGSARTFSFVSFLCGFHSFSLQASAWALAIQRLDSTFSKLQWPWSRGQVTTILLFIDVLPALVFVLFLLWLAFVPISSFSIFLSRLLDCIWWRLSELVLQITLLTLIFCPFSHRRQRWVLWPDIRL